MFAVIHADSCDRKEGGKWVKERKRKTSERYHQERIQLKTSRLQQFDFTYLVDFSQALIEKATVNPLHVSFQGINYINTAFTVSFQRFKEISLNILSY